MHASRFLLLFHVAHDELPNTGKSVRHHAHRYAHVAQSVSGQRHGSRMQARQVNSARLQLASSSSEAAAVQRRCSTIVEYNKQLAGADTADQLQAAAAVPQRLLRLTAMPAQLVPAMSLGG